MGFFKVEMKVRVKISKEKKAELLTALRGAEDVDPIYKGLSQCTTVKDAFDVARYEAILSKKGYYYVREFLGRNLCNDEKFWRRLAHLIIDGSYINIYGEDHSRWKWKFKDGKLVF